MTIKQLSLEEVLEIRDLERLDYIFVLVPYKKNTKKFTVQTLLQCRTASSYTIAQLLELNTDGVAIIEVQDLPWPAKQTFENWEGVCNELQN